MISFLTKALEELEEMVEQHLSIKRDNEKFNTIEFQRCHVFYPLV